MEENYKAEPRFRGCMLWRIMLSLREIGKRRLGVSLGGKVMSLALDMLSNKKISKWKFLVFWGMWYHLEGENKSVDIDQRVFGWSYANKCGEGNGNPLQYSCLENPMDGGAWWATVHGVAESDMTERPHFHFSLHTPEKEMATHSSVLPWRISGMAEPGRLPSMGLHRVRYDWCDLAAAAAACPTLKTSYMPS